MKAKIKETGEYVDVSETFIGERTYRDKHGNSYYETDLEIESVADDIDWEKRRYEIAKDLLSSMIRKNYYCGTDSYIEDCADDAVRFSDALISSLRK